MRKSKINKFIVNAMLVFACVMIIGSVNVLATTGSVSGTLNHRVLDGGKNGKYYTIGSGKNVTISGTVKKTKKENTLPSLRILMKYVVFRK